MAVQRSRNYLVDVIALLVLASIGFTGYKFVPVYIGSYVLKNEVNRVVVEAQRGTTEAELRKSLVDVCAAHDLALADEQLEIKMSNQLVKVHVEYDRVVPIPATSKAITMHFVIDSSRDLRSL